MSITLQPQSSWRQSGRRIFDLSGGEKIQNKEGRRKKRIKIQKLPSTQFREVFCHEFENMVEFYILKILILENYSKTCQKVMKFNFLWKVLVSKFKQQGSKLHKKTRQNF